MAAQLIFAHLEDKSNWTMEWTFGKNRQASTALFFRGKAFKYVTSKLENITSQFCFSVFIHLKHKNALKYMLEF